MKKIATLLVLFCMAITLNAQNQNEEKPKRPELELGSTMPQLDLKSEVYGNITNKDLKGKVVLINMFATWCGPCRQTAPILDDIAREYAGKIVVYKVDVDKCGQVAQAMGISSIPAILYIPTDGNQPVMTVGGRGKDRFKAEIAKHLLK